MRENGRFSQSLTGKARKKRRGEEFFSEKSRSFAESCVSGLLKRCEIFTIRNKREVLLERRRFGAAASRLNFQPLFRRLFFRVGRSLKASSRDERTGGKRSGGVGGLGSALFALIY
jgi:hypothetical protein